MIGALEGRHLAREAARKLIGADPDEDAVRHLDGVAVLESQRSAGWRSAGRGSNNMGAIQAGASWKGDVFSYFDTHPNKDGTSTRYRVDFRSYPTPQAGYDDLARVMFGGRRKEVLVVASLGDTYSVSELMRKTGYYEGFGPTQRDRIRNHYLALRRSVLKTDFALGMPVPRSLDDLPIGQPQTLRSGARGDDVRTLQRELQIAADGLFGPKTEEAVILYQGEHGLTVDGVVGPRTWAVLLTDEYIPIAA